jgi:hypothetical protein
VIGLGLQILPDDIDINGHGYDDCALWDQHGKILFVQIPNYQWKKIAPEIWRHRRGVL